RQDSNVAAVDQIVKIELEQYYDEKTLLGRHVIFDSTNVEEIVDEAPSITGVGNHTIKVGAAFDPLDGVKATDKEDGDLTSKIQIDGTIDNEKPGEYTLIYSVEDSKNNKTTVNRVIKVVEPSSFGVGQGIKWPKQVMAPFADMSAYVSTGNYGNNGAPNLEKISQESDIKYFNLGFIQAKNIDNGEINWAWGGYTGLNEKENEGWQYEGIKKSIRDLRKSGGDIAVSFGGLNSGAFWEKTQDVDTLYKAYSEIVEGYGLTRVDFDVEAGAMGYQHNVANAKAVKRLQDETGISTTLTLPVMNTGLISTGLDVLRAYLEEGVNLDMVNIMTMVYGSSVPDYAVGSVQAMDNTKDQLKEYYRKYSNITLTDQQAYAKLGVTTSIGFESSDHPYFSVKDMDLVVKHAIQKNIGMMSFWSINRDTKIDGGAGQVENKYEFSAIANQFKSK
uniref:immunoglobulin-like domain-containing protein n=1 Tax=Enterococcus faecium TaxID=1352 RepID=UPI003132CD91